jgi:hypothetical protein
MHPIDQQLHHMLRGEFAQGWEISQDLEQAGAQAIPVAEDKTTEEMWMRHTFNRGWFLLQQGRYQEGSVCLEAGRHLNVYGGGVLKTNAPIFNPEKHDIRDKTVIISLEGGFGDEIIHARFAQSFKHMGAKSVILAAAPEVHSIFSRIPGVDQVITRDQTNLVVHDYWVPGFSAGWVCGHTHDDLPRTPYLSALPSSHEIWQSIIRSDKKKVGIRWAGNPKFEHQQFRRFPVDFMLELAKYPEMQIYSLQRDTNIEQLPENIIDLQHLLISWEDTLAAISNLDLVVTSCTSIAHASAAMGKETWVMVPILPYHIWAHGAPYSNVSPYYGSATLYRQPEFEKWNGAFQQLYKDLEAKWDLAPIVHPNLDLTPKKLNLGCGFMHMEGFLNVDSSQLVDADEVVDLEVTPWPWKNNEFSHVVAKDILEHLGDTPTHFIKILQELYRVSNNGAVWEVQVPHARCDHAFDDVTHKRQLSPESFRLFDRKEMYDRRKRSMSCSPLAFEHGMDIEVCDVKYEWTSLVREKLRNNEIDANEFSIMFNTLNNIAESTQLLIQVHKPGRYSTDEFKALGKTP